MTVRKRARIIYNPTSGRETLRSDLVDILAIYEKAGYETSAFATTGGVAEQHVSAAPV